MDSRASAGGGGDAAAEVGPADGCFLRFGEDEAVGPGLGVCGEPPSSESPQPLPIEPHLVCTYQVTESGDDWRLIAADRIGPAQLEPINSALAESVPEASCRRGIESRYAVMYPAERDGEFATYVAVDGCAVQQDDRWWRASDQLRALLTVG